MKGKDAGDAGPTMAQLEAAGIRLHHYIAMGKDKSKAKAGKDNKKK